MLHAPLSNVHTQDPRRYADVDDTDNESEGGRAPSTQGGAGGIFGLFKGSTPQHYKQPAPKRVKVSVVKATMARLPMLCLIYDLDWSQIVHDCSKAHCKQQLF